MKASGRLEAMQPDWTLYPPLLRGSTLLPPKGDPGVWANMKALQSENLNRMLIQYTRWAGLQADKVRFTTLRRTAIHRMDKIGVSVEEMCKRLGFVHPKNLKAYLVKLRAYPKVELWSPEGPEPHQPRQEQGEYWAHQGVHPAMKHGLYAKSLPEPWLEELFDDLPDLAEVDFEQEPLMWEMAVARVRSIRLTELSKDATTLKEVLFCTQQLGVQAGRMARAVNEWNRLRREKLRKEYMHSSTLVKVLRRIKFRTTSGTGF